MIRRGLALAALAIAGCHDAPPRPPAPRPAAALQAARESRALLAEALTQAIGRADQVRRLAPPPPTPTTAMAALDDTAGSLADQLAALDADDDSVAVGGLGLRGVGPGDPDADPSADPDPDDAVVGGVVGGVAGTLGPLAGSTTDITLQLLTDADDLDQDVYDRLTGAMRRQVRQCRDRAVIDGTMTDDVTALITLVHGAGGIAVHVSGGGPLTRCLERASYRSLLTVDTMVSFQVTIPVL